MPVVSRAVHIDGYSLLDGGISDSIPVQYARNQGYDRIVTVLTRPKDYVKAPTGHDHLYGLLLHKYPQVAASLRNRHTIGLRKWSISWDPKENFVSSIRKKNWTSAGRNTMWRAWTAPIKRGGSGHRR